MSEGLRKCNLIQQNATHTETQKISATYHYGRELYYLLNSGFAHERGIKRGGSQHCKYVS